MKLNAPGSSSDLETAREIAYRLHQRRKAGERPTGGSPPAAGAARLQQRPSGPSEAAPLLRPSPPPAQPHPPETLPSVPRRPPAGVAPAFAPEPPAPPSWDDAVPTRPPGSEDALSALTDDSEVESIGTPPGLDDAIEIEDSGASIEEIVGPADLPSVDEIDGSAGLADEEEPAESGDAALAPDTAEVAASDSPFGDEPSANYTSEELFDLPQTGPSWSEVADNCMTITRARGAMLVDPAGHVLAVSGSWPDPGAEAIAGKLVAMMAKTLKDAPTRSVSAPVGSLHLTAWRVPLAEGLITTAFLADAPLLAEVRTPVDAEILRGAP